VSFATLAAVVWLPLLALLGGVFSGGAAANGRIMVDLGDVHRLAILGRSIFIALCAAAAGTLFGLVPGYAAFCEEARGRSLIVLAMTFPLLIPPFVHALSWIALFDWFGASLSGFGPTVLILALSFSPVAALLTFAGLLNVQGSTSDAAFLARPPLAVFRRIHLRLIEPHLWTAFLLIALFSLSDYGVPSLLRVNTYPVIVFSEFAACYDLRGAILSAWPYLVLPAAALVLWRCRVARRLFETVQGQGELARPRGPIAGSPFWRIGFVVFFVFAALLPIASLVVTAGGASSYVSAWRTASAQLVRSLGYALLSASLITMIAIVVGFGLRASSKMSNVIQDYTSLLPIGVPGTLYGVGLIALWNHSGTALVYGSTAMLVFLYLSRFSPFAVRALLVGREQIGRDVLDAARLSHASNARILRRIVLPLVAPSAVAGWCLCTVLCLRELAGTLLVSPPGTETLAVRIYSLYHYGAGKLVAALSLVLVGTSMGVLAVAVLLARKVRPC
jgi:iron(III) transport system permease protein